MLSSLYTCRLDALAINVGVVQATTGGTGRFDVPVQDIENNIKEAVEYMETVTLKKDLMDLCKNEHEMCSIWAVAGECDVNPGCKYIVNMMCFFLCLV